MWVHRASATHMANRAKDLVAEETPDATGLSQLRLLSLQAKLKHLDGKI